MTNRIDQPAGALTLEAAVDKAQHEYIEALPYKLMQKEWKRYAEVAGGANQWAFPPIATADNNPTVKMSPDVLYSILSYDVSEKPLRISAPVSREPFWSLTLFQENTDNFFGIDDRDVSGDTFQLIILGPNHSAQAGEGVYVVASPTETGIAIIRCVVPTPDALEKLDELRREATATPVDAP